MDEKVTTAQQAMQLEETLEEMALGAYSVSNHELNTACINDRGDSSV